MVSIREKRPDDLNALRTIFLQTRLKTYTWLNTTYYKLTDFDDQAKDERILVAVFEGCVIGFISLWMEDNFIHHLYVDGKYQHQNAGSELLNAAIVLLKFPIRLKCLEKNVKAAEFYQRRGFCNCGTGLSEDGLYMILELSQDPILK
ncbi:MAG: GNAT family N-acetyltransferase [Janthinobacterium lividum]